MMINRVILCSDCGCKNNTSITWIHVYLHSPAHYFGRLLFSVPKPLFFLTTDCHINFKASEHLTI